MPKIIRLIVINITNTLTNTIKIESILVEIRFLCSSMPSALLRPFMIQKIALEDKNTVIKNPNTATIPPCSNIKTSFKTSLMRLTESVGATESRKAIIGVNNDFYP